MKIRDFDVVRWMDAYETKCEVNIAESFVDSKINWGLDLLQVFTGALL